MKNFRMKMFPVIAIAMLFQVTVFANNTNPTVDRSKLFVEKVGDLSFKVRIINLENEATSILLKDVEGKLIYSKNVKNNNAFVSNFDLKNLKNGAYYLHINRENKKYIQAIDVSNEGVTTGELKEIIRPAVAIGKNVFTVSQELVNVEEVVIYNERNKAVYSDDFANKNTSVLHFNVKDLGRGEYNIAIKTADKIYFETIKVK